MSAVPPAPRPLEWVKHLLDSSQALNFAHFLAVAKPGQNRNPSRPRSWRVSQSASATCCHFKRAGTKRKPLPEETFFYGILPPSPQPSFYPLSFSFFSLVTGKLTLIASTLHDRHSVMEGKLVKQRAKCIFGFPRGKFGSLTDIVNNKHLMWPSNYLPKKSTRTRKSYEHFADRPKGKMVAPDTYLKSGYSTN